MRDTPNTNDELRDVSQKLPERRSERFLRTATLFLGLLFASYLGPLLSEIAYYKFHIALPDLLFFLPQILFPYDLVMLRSENESRRVFSDATALTLGIVQWIFVMAAFSWFARNVRFRYLVPLTLVVIVGVGYVVAFALGLFGMRVEFDGP